MASNIPYLQDTLMIGVDLYGDDGKDDAVLTVSRQIMGSIVLVKTFRGDEAIDIYNKLIDKERLDEVVKQAEIELEEEHAIVMEKVAAKKEPDPFFRGIMTERAADALMDLAIRKDVEKHDQKIRECDLFPELSARKICLEPAIMSAVDEDKKEDLKNGDQ